MTKKELIEAIREEHRQLRIRRDECAIKRLPTEWITTKLLGLNSILHKAHKLTVEQLHEEFKNN